MKIKTFNLQLAVSWHSQARETLLKKIQNVPWSCRKNFWSPGKCFFHDKLHILELVALFWFSTLVTHFDDKPWWPPPVTPSGDPLRWPPPATPSDPIPSNVISHILFSFLLRLPCMDGSDLENSWFKKRHHINHSSNQSAKNISSVPS